jgi:hypothetical protein
MTREIRRGYVDTDREQFAADKLPILRKAQQEILYLLERGYPMKNASTFVGNHYMLSERQRLALVRATAERDLVQMRLHKLVKEGVRGQEVFIDGLNLIITLEVALSGSTLIRCMDLTIRDLAGLRGTYRLIDKTDMAIRLIGDMLAELGVVGVTFYLDAPVSNSGRLKSRIFELLAAYPFALSVKLADNVDYLLKNLNNVATSDAIILNHCGSYLNLAADIIQEKLPFAAYVDLSQA